MNKEEFKKHVIDLINSMGDIYNFKVSAEVLDTIRPGSEWRECKQTGNIEIKIIGRRGFE